MKKKTIIGIVIAVVVLLILILGYGEVTGKFSIFGRKYKEGTYVFYALHYPTPESTGSLKKGRLGTDINWATVSYTFPTYMAYSVTSYRDITAERILANREGYTEETVNGITYQKKVSDMDETHKLYQYYTTINGSTYYISCTMLYNTENVQAFNSFLNSLTIGEEEAPIDPNTLEDPDAPDPSPDEPSPDPDNP